MSYPLDYNKTPGSRSFWDMYVWDVLFLFSLWWKGPEEMMGNIKAGSQPSFGYLSIIYSSLVFFRLSLPGNMYTDVDFLKKYCAIGSV